MPSPVPTLPTLTRESILDAAMAVVEADGMASLSLRRVAREMGRAPMSLYRHVDGVESLLEGVVQRLVDGIQMVDHGADWQRTLDQAARGLREMFIRYPGVLQVIMASGVQTDGMLRTLDTIMGALLTAGLTPEEAAKAHRALFSTIVGDSMMARAAHDLLGSTFAQQQSFVQRMTDFGADRFPNISAVASAWIGSDPDEGFQFALDRLLAGIAALAEH